MKNNLKKIRQEKGFTQVEIADKAQISVRYYQGLEAGTSEPTIKIAQLLSKALNTDLDIIFPLS